MRLLTHDQVSDLPSKPFEPRMPYTPACLLSRPTEPEYQKPGIFNKRKAEESNAALKADYETRLEAYEAEKRACDEEKARAEAEYETQMKAYNQQLEQRNRMIRKAAEGNLQGELKKMEGSGEANREAAIQSPALMFVKREIEAAEENAVAAMAMRKALYSQDVIHPKYANFLAVCTIFDYLDTYRCEELAGPNGAYNLYESELRANTIISKLEGIEKKLDDIQVAQYSVYMALTSMGASLASIDDKMDKAVAELSAMSKGVASIEKSSAATAYHAEAAARYAEINAEIAAAPSFGIIF